MSSFSDLPLELIELVTECLSPGTIPAWSQVNSLCRSLALPRLAVLRVQYRVVERCSTLQTILEDPGLAYLVQRIGKLKWEGTWSHAEFDNVYDRLAVTGLEMLPGGTAAELENLNPSVDAQEIASLVCLAFTRFQRLQSLLIGVPQEDFSEARIRKREAMKARPRPSSEYKKEYANAGLQIMLGKEHVFRQLENLTIHTGASAHLDPETIMHFLRLPKLRCLEVVDHGDPPIPWWEPDDGIGSTHDYAREPGAIRPPLETLRLGWSELSWQTVECFLRLGKPSTIKTLELCPSPIIGSMHNSRMNEVLIHYCEETLEHLDYLSPVFEENVLDEIKRRNELDEDTSLQATFSLSPIAFNKNINLKGFEKLKFLHINSALLLNGYGPVTMAHERGPVSDAWIESDFSLAPPLSELLPPSIESLKIECHPIQFDVLDSQLRPILKPLGENLIPGLPKLKYISVYHDWDDQAETYWSRQLGFVGKLSPTDEEDDDDDEDSSSDDDDGDSDDEPEEDVNDNDSEADSDEATQDSLEGDSEEDA